MTAFDSCMILSEDLIRKKYHVCLRSHRSCWSQNIPCFSKGFVFSLWFLTSLFLMINDTYSIIF